MKNVCHGQMIKLVGEDHAWVGDVDRNELTVAVTVKTRDNGVFPARQGTDRAVKLSAAWAWVRTGGDPLIAGGWPRCEQDDGIVWICYLQGIDLSARNGCKNWLQEWFARVDLAARVFKKKT